MSDEDEDDDEGDDVAHHDCPASHPLCSSSFPRLAALLSSPFPTPLVADHTKREKERVERGRGATWSCRPPLAGLWVVIVQPWSALPLVGLLAWME